MLKNFYNSTSWTQFEKKFDQLSRPGILLLINIQNHHDLLVIASEKEINEVVRIFQESLLTLCKVDSSDMLVMYPYILVLLPGMIKDSLEKLAYQIYATAQIATIDRSLLNLKCKITSLNFPEHESKLKNLLTLGLSYLARDTVNYYTEFSGYSYQTNLKDKIEKLTHFKQCYQRDQLIFAYQPIIESKSGYISHYECLLRLPDSSNQLVSAGPFILLAEEFGFINVIDQFALQLAVEELINAPNIKLAVNISNQGIADPYLAKTAARLLQDEEVAKRLIVEITETSLNNDYIRTKKFLNEMHEKGCQIAIDDFGTGFTSFRQLKDLPIDIVKIDGSFIRDLTSNYYHKFLVETLVKMSEELGIKTIAEFVENGQIAKFLIDIEVDGLQGNFFCPATNYRFWSKNI